MTAPTVQQAPPPSRTWRTWSEDMFLHVPNEASPVKTVHVSPHSSWFRHGWGLELETEGIWEGRVITSWRVPGKEKVVRETMLVAAAGHNNCFASLGIRNDLVQGNLIRGFNCTYKNRAPSHRIAPHAPGSARKGRPATCPSRGGAANIKLESACDHQLWRPSRHLSGSARPARRNPIFDKPAEAIAARCLSSRTTTKSHFPPPPRPCEADVNEGDSKS